MKLVGCVTVLALLLASQPTVCAQGPTRATRAPGPIQTSVQSMRWLPSVEPAARGIQGPLAPAGFGTRMSRRQVAVLLGILGGAVGGFFVADSLCKAGHHNECDLPGGIFGVPIGAAAGGVAVAWVTK